LFYKVGIPGITRDMAAIADMHPLMGVLSNFGVLLWSAAAFVSGFTALTLKSYLQSEYLYFLIWSTSLSAYLLLDDFFMIHEDIAPKHFGINQRFIFVLLAIFAIYYLVAFYKVILQTNYSLIFFALFFLGASVFVDVILEEWLLLKFSSCGPQYS
jgi:hypothetical protein